MKRCVLAVDLGGTKIAAACVHNTGKISRHILVPTPPAGGIEVVETLADILRQLATKVVGALSIAVPGLAYPNGTVWAPNIPGWERMPLGPILRRRFRLPVLVESDRNAFVVGETWKGISRNCTDVVFIAIGTGIGTGIISNGRLLRGSHELSGCLGWMAVDGRFEPSYKSVGCLEAHVAGPGISRAGSKIFNRRLTAAEIVQMARKGNRTARWILGQAGEFLGRGLANLVDILNPEMIVLGGGVAAAGNLLLRPAIRTMKLWAQPLAVKQVHVVRSSLGVHAGLLGAAKLAFDRFPLANRARQ